VAEGQEGKDAYCPCCLHCNPPPKPNFPMPSWLQPKLQRDRVKLDDLPVKWKRW
jgi:hypothetical protein